MIHRIAEYIPLPASLMASLRAEESRVEVTDEIRELLRTMNDGANGKPAAGEAEPVVLPAGGAEQGREPGSDDQ
jgi:hypothetical protein